MQHQFSFLESTTASGPASPSLSEAVHAQAIGLMAEILLRVTGAVDQTADAKASQETVDEQQ